jgi:hypothetical protein
MTVYYERKEWTVVFGSYSWALAWVYHFIYRDMDWEGGKAFVECIGCVAMEARV